MLLDVLTGIPSLKICVAYTLDGNTIDYIPANITDLERCEPVYIKLDGWQEDITKTTTFSDLPHQAQVYLNTISELVGVHVSLFSVGPDRTQTIVLEDVMANKKSD
jgi:adenylosuccinate synthase